MNTKILFLFLFSMMSLFTPLVLSEELIKVEGVMSGLGDDPDQLYVLMNQEVYGVGDSILDYEVIAVDKKGVRLKTASSENEKYFLVGSVVGESAQVQEVDASLKESESTVENLNLGDKLSSYFEGVKKTIQQIQYSAVIRDLKKIQFAAMERALTTGNNRIAIQQLIADGRLPPLFSNAENGGYRFKIHAVSPGLVRTTAEPIEASEEKPFFLIDEHSYVYVEKGQTATQRSETYTGDLAISVQAAN